MHNILQFNVWYCEKQCWIMNQIDFNVVQACDNLLKSFEYYFLNYIIRSDVRTYLIFDSPIATFVFELWTEYCCVFQWQNTYTKSVIEFTSIRLSKNMIVLGKKIFVWYISFLVQTINSFKEWFKAS